MLLTIADAPIITSKLNKADPTIVPIPISAKSPGFNTDIIDCKDIENILLTNKIKNIRWDNIESLYQRNDLSRLLMFKVNTLKLGLEIIEKIEKNFYLKSKIYNLILSNNGML